MCVCVWGGEGGGDSNAHYALERGRGGREEKKKKEEGDRRERGGKNVSCVSEVFT